MNKFQVYRTLRRHVKLSERRNVAFETNSIAKFFMILGGAMLVLYMMFIAVLLSLIANDSTTFTAPQFFFSILPFLLAVDFLARFFMQHTPSQMVKPYLLLPLRRYDCVDCFLLSSVFSYGNLLWLSVTLPFSLMSVLFGYGLFPTLFLVLGFHLFIVCNSLFYMLCRTLVIERAWLILLPLLVYALLFIPWPISGITKLLSVYSGIGTLVTDCNPLLFLLLLGLLFVLFMVNRIVQYRCIKSETQAEKELNLRSISSFDFFDRFNQTGEYLKLELKMVLRNKNMRKTFLLQIVFVVILSLLNSFTDIYDDDFSTQFWSVYPFILVGINHVCIMSYEGNFIECLMVRKENIRSLLEAKYYFYSVVLLLPLLLMLPTVFTGKYSLLMLVSLMIFTAGPLFCLLMQLAVTNKQTLPLNTKLTKKSGLETNYIQVVYEVVALFAPSFILPMLKMFFSDTMTYVILMAIGLVFIFTHKYWINNIYVRMMKRKYTNLEGFMTSR